MKDNKVKATENVAGDGTLVHKKTSGTSNLIAIIICVLVAFVVWIYVMSVVKNDYTKEIMLDLSIVGEETLAENGFHVFDKSVSKVKITVKGTKAELLKFTENDYRAYVDVSAVKQSGANTYNIGFDTPATSTSTLTIVSSEPAIAVVTIDALLEKNIPDIRYSNSTDNFNFISSDSSLKISGAKQYVDNVSYVMITIKESNLTAGKTITPVDIKLYDANNAIIPKTYIIIDTEDFTVMITEKVE